MKYKQVGGTPSEGLPADFTTALQSLLSGTSGAAGATSQAANANPMASTQGVAGILQDLLSGGAGKIGGSMQQMITTQQKQNVDALRSRYSVGGGTAFGTPAAFAESQYRSTEAPQLVSAIGGLQQNALSQLLPIFAALTARGTPQAEIVGQENPWLSGFKALAQVGGEALSLFGGMNAGASAPPPTTSLRPTDINSMFPPPPGFNPQYQNPFGR